MDAAIAAEGTVVSVNTSARTGTAKAPVPRITVDERGVVGDAHAGTRGREVSLLAREAIERFAVRTGRTVEPGGFAENITTAGVDLAKVALLDRIAAGEAELEVTLIGKACHGEGCAIFREVGECVMPREGIFARVLQGGAVAPGDAVRWLPRALRVAVITVSDRASRGEYEDRGGPLAVRTLQEFFAPTRWHAAIQSEIVPDDADRLRQALVAARERGADVIVTTGGTGIGPRDITPDVVAAMADRTLPGIMEHIRLKHGAARPAALLSRSVAALAGRTLIYTLPGSPRAVQEYLAEILKSLEHAICVLNGLDPH